MIMLVSINKVGKKILRLILDMLIKFIIKKTIIINSLCFNFGIPS